MLLSTFIMQYITPNCFNYYSLLEQNNYNRYVRAIYNCYLL